MLHFYYLGVSLYILCIETKDYWADDSDKYCTLKIFGLSRRAQRKWFVPDCSQAAYGANDPRLSPLITLCFPRWKRQTTAVLVRPPLRVLNQNPTATKRWDRKRIRWLWEVVRQRRCLTDALAPYFGLLESHSATTRAATGTDSPERRKPHRCWQLCWVSNATDTSCRLLNYCIYY